MPANKKYLSQSPWFKLGKLSAAILGSLMASVMLHAALAVWTDRDIVMATAVLGRLHGYHILGFKSLAGMVYSGRNYFVIHNGYLFWAVISFKEHGK
ncbi:hypothetical protein ACSV4D_01890 [Flavobacterium sp. ARAG 55.4]|uniref:hypothetical protein n=1 Tax=Flavobacterium sp. ARAG 55.4 TaxID=3451357 RepID=UPI003F48A39F